MSTTEKMSLTAHGEEIDAPPRIAPRIRSAPKIRQIYWCDFPEDAILPEMWKRRPVLILSRTHKLNGHCSVLPTSTGAQSGPSARWAHELTIRLSGMYPSWVICNHIYTVSTARLHRPGGSAIPRVPKAEFDAILEKVYRWLPVPP